MLFPQFETLFPVLSTSLWLSTLIALAVYWLANGRPHYSSMYQADQTIPWVSDIAASHAVKPYFIFANCLTAFVTVSFIVLYSRPPLETFSPRGKGRRLSFLVCVLIGWGAFVLLSFVDVASNRPWHEAFFRISAAANSIAFILQYRSCRSKFNRSSPLRGLQVYPRAEAYAATQVFLMISLIAACLLHDMNAGAILEWLLVFTFGFYVWMF